MIVSRDMEWRQIMSRDNGNCLRHITTIRERGHYNYGINVRNGSNSSPKSRPYSWLSIMRDIRVRISQCN